MLWRKRRRRKRPIKKTQFNSFLLASFFEEYFALPLLPLFCCCFLLFLRSIPNHLVIWLKNIRFCIAGAEQWKNLWRSLGKNLNSFDRDRHRVLLQYPRSNHRETEKTSKYLSIRLSSNVISFVYAKICIQFSFDLLGDVSFFRAHRNVW